VGKLSFKTFAEKQNIATKIAFKFMRQQAKSTPSFTSTVSTLGVCVGVASFLVVVIIFNSFENQLRDILLSANPNLVVFRLSSGIPNPEQYESKLINMIGKEKIVSSSLFEYNEALLSKDSHTSAVVLRGVQGSDSSSAEEMSRAITPTGALNFLNDSSDGKTKKSLKFNKINIFPAIIGKGLALKLGAKQNDIVSLTTGGLGFSGSEKIHKFKIVGILNVGLSQYDEKLMLLSFRHAQFLFGEPNKAKGIEIKLKNPAQAFEISKLLKSQTPYTVKSWQEIHTGLFEQIERDGTAIKIIVLIITLVAGFNIIVTLSLSVIDRTKHIALLRCLGASKWLILRIFLTMGVCLGFLGSLLGVLLAFAVLKVFSGFELGELQAFYFLEKIPVDFDWQLFLKAVMVACGLSFLSALYPAYKATKVTALKA
jgi:lipoprotein-releasing system permease protein